MNIDHDAVKELLSRLTEGLNVEVKSWINPGDANGVAKIVKAALALRNRNGGYLVIGFDDKTLQPDTAVRPADVRGAFHLDKIQELISRHSFDF
jgi:predicted HTH transcriptional regulator